MKSARWHFALFMTLVVTALGQVSPLKYDGKHPYMKKFHLPACEPNDLSVLDE